MRNVPAGIRTMSAGAALAPAVEAGGPPGAPQAASTPQHRATATVLTTRQARGGGATGSGIMPRPSVPPLSRLPASWSPIRRMGAV